MAPTNDTRKRAPDERRRNQRARDAILAASLELLDREGFRALTVEAIAADAGVGKATIYRWWSGKAEVVMDAVGERLNPEISFPDTGSVREDLRLQLESVIELFTTARAGKAYLALIAESQHDPALGKALGERYIAARRAAAATVFERGIARGELRSDLDIGIAIDALYGAIYYRLLVSGAHTNPAYAEQLLRQLYPAMVRRGG